ncbi:hypothetical protein DICA3_A03334 [Diutina catenulata]
MNPFLLSVLAVANAAALSKRDASMTITYYAAPDCAPRGACGLDCVREDTITLNRGDTWDGFKLPGTNQVHAFKVKWNDAQGDVGLRLFEKCTGWSKSIWNGDEECHIVSKGVESFKLETGHSTHEDPNTGDSCDKDGASKTTEQGDSNDTGSDADGSAPSIDATSVATFKPVDVPGCKYPKGEWRGEAVVSNEKVKTGNKPILEAIKEFRKTKLHKQCGEQICTDAEYTFTPSFYQHGIKTFADFDVKLSISGNFNERLDFFMDRLEDAVENSEIEKYEEQGGSGRFSKVAGGPLITKVKQYESPNLYKFSMSQDCNAPAITFEFKVESDFKGEVNWCEIGSEIFEMSNANFKWGADKVQDGINLICTAIDAIKGEKN